MAIRTTHHVTKKKSGGWNVKKEGANRASGNFGTKEQTVNRGKELAKGAPLGQIKIHGGMEKFKLSIRMERTHILRKVESCFEQESSYQK